MQEEGRHTLLDLSTPPFLLILSAPLLMHVLCTPPILHIPPTNPSTPPWWGLGAQV